MQGAFQDETGCRAITDSSGSGFQVQMKGKVVVIGGGMVGVCCAWFLLKRGWQVTLVERREIGVETSYGNAGVITRGSILPLNNPRLWKSLPGYLGNHSAAVRYDPLYLARHSWWLARFLANARDEQTLRAAAALNELMTRALPVHKALMQEADVLPRLRENGWLKLYRHAERFDSSAYERRIYDHFGVSYQIVEREQIQALEPALQPIFNKGILVTDTASVDNPGAVVQAYAAAFVAQGGVIRQGTVTDARQVGGEFVVSIQQGVNSFAEHADQLVLAAGPWSNQLLKPYGWQLPICYERGSHYHYLPQAGVLPHRPFYDVESAYVMTPTDNGVRVTSGSHLLDIARQAEPLQLQQVLPRVQEALPLASQPVSPLWQGNRPSTPDALPILGALPGVPGVWLATGHQHVGFSTGPVSAKALAALIDGEQPEFDMRPFSPSRFRF
ncbi:NAD(P)/FAD-dependent oxidoreductase [Pokkaliibacter plantistimulans]|nr:FAD-dependent oxidoreductase [Pokkaliibacter plantistimulans]